MRDPKELEARSAVTEERAGRVGAAVLAHVTQLTLVHVLTGALVRLQLETGGTHALETAHGIDARVLAARARKSFRRCTLVHI